MMPLWFWFALYVVLASAYVSAESRNNEGLAAVILLTGAGFLVGILLKIW